MIKAVVSKSILFVAFLAVLGLASVSNAWTISSPTVRTNKAEFINLGFQDNFGRLPTQSEFIQWNTVLGSTLSCKSANKILLRDSKNIFRPTSLASYEDRLEYILHLYQVLFWRMPDIDGFNFWMKAAENMSVSTLEDYFLNSGELKEKCESIGLYYGGY